MHLLVLMNYFEKRAEANNRLRDLIAQVAQNLMKKEEKIKLENGKWLRIVNCEYWS